MFSRPLLWVLLLLVALPEARAGEPKETGRGTLQIVTNYWADVYVDGKRRGRAPMPPISLPAGRHVVRLVNPVVGKYQREVIIRTGERTELHVSPDSPQDSAPVEPSGKEPARPRASSTEKPVEKPAENPAGKSRGRAVGTLRLVMGFWADVYVDGKRMGRAPMKAFPLPTGRHVVELRGNPAFEPYREEIVIREGEAVELTPEPKPVE